MHLNQTARTVRFSGEAHISRRPAIHVRSPSWSRTRARLESFADLSGQRAGKSSWGSLRQSEVVREDVCLAIAPISVAGGHMMFERKKHFDEGSVWEP
jgi:hypothetical protein